MADRRPIGAHLSEAIVHRAVLVDEADGDAAGNHHRERAEERYRDGGAAALLAAAGHGFVSALRKKMVRYRSVAVVGTTFRAVAWKGSVTWNETAALRLETEILGSLPSHPCTVRVSVPVQSGIGLPAPAQATVTGGNES